MPYPGFELRTFGTAAGCPNHCTAWSACMGANTSASNWCISLNSNLVLLLQVRQTLLILVNAGSIDFLQEKRSLYIMTYGVKFLNAFLCVNNAFDWAQIWYVYYWSPSDESNDFEEFRIYSSGTSKQKRILIH